MLKKIMKLTVKEISVPVTDLKTSRRAGESLKSENIAFMILSSCHSVLLDPVWKAP